MNRTEKILYNADRVAVIGQFIGLLLIPYRYYSIYLFFRTSKLMIFSEFWHFLKNTHLDIYKCLKLYQLEATRFSRTVLVVFQ